MTGVMSRIQGEGVRQLSRGWNLAVPCTVRAMDSKVGWPT